MSRGRNRRRAVTEEPPRPTVRVEVRGPLGPAAVGLICARVRPLLVADGRTAVVCEVAGSVDIGVVDTIARLALMVRDREVGAGLEVTGADLSELLAFAGLDGVLGRGTRGPFAGRRGLRRAPYR